MSRGRSCGRSYARSVFGRAGRALARARATLDHLGDRPYDVTVRVLRWTGGGPGRGEAVVKQDLKLSPTPDLRGLDMIRHTMTAAGYVEEGSVVAIGVHPGHDRENLLGIDAAGNPLAEDFEIVWTVTYWPATEGAPTKTRRFHPASGPERDPVNGWKVLLVPAK